MFLGTFVWVCMRMCVFLFACVCVSLSLSLSLCISTDILNVYCAAL